MVRMWISIGLLALLLASLSGTRAADDTPSRQASPKQLPPIVVQLLNASPEAFLQRFDKDKDGFVGKDELPPFLAAQFAEADANADGKLDRAEIAAFLQLLRKRFGSSAAVPDPATAPAIERAVNNFLMRMDTNKDGKISRAEARGAVAANFDRLDTNKDGFLDKEELRRGIQRLRPGLGGAAAPQRAKAEADGPDFDALDLNADGRLTRAELQGTPFAALFDAIDTNKDGKIDPNEFQAYLKKQAEQKAKAAGQK